MFFAQKKSELAKNAKIHAFDAKISGEIDKTISNGARMEFSPSGAENP